MRGEALPDGGAATAVRTEVLPAFYQDSVVLMRIAAQVRGSPAVREVALFMGTPANHALLEQAGPATPAGRGAGPNDLIATVSADVTKPPQTRDRAGQVAAGRDEQGEIHMRAIPCRSASLARSRSVVRR